LVPFRGNLAFSNIVYIDVITLTMNIAAYVVWSSLVGVTKKECLQIEDLIRKFEEFQFP